MQTPVTLSSSLQPFPPSTPKQYIKMVRSLKNPKKAKRKNKGGKKSSEGPAAKVWQPGVDRLEEDEELHCHPSAYNSLLAFHIGWPSLSFDILRDSLGLVRSEFPHTVYCAFGTQAGQASGNSIGIFKLSNISGKRRDVVPAKKNAEGSDMESDSSDSDEDDEIGGSGAPILQLRKVFHDGCVNRIRAMSQNPHICASWADNGYVQVWDFSSQINALAESTASVSTGATTAFNQVPLAKFKHEDEGYALDWSPLVPGRLVSGDCKNSIHLWEPSSGATWNIDPSPFVGHTASVEDLQWNPTEPHMFASCSMDGSIAIWDTRSGKSPAGTIVEAHKTDVNVISWNRLASCMLASGSDDGTISIWDLRLLTDGDSKVAHFEYHKHPITSIEWSPHEASTLATSSDNQLTIWDLSLERDEEEEVEFRTKTEEQVDAPSDLPPQLLFVHQGQKNLKEVHWHSQIPGMLISTAADGFNVLMPSNIENLLPPADA